MFVHASFAFVHAVERGAILTDPLSSAVNAILECEALAMSGPVPPRAGVHRQAGAPIGVAFPESGSRDSIDIAP